MPCRFSASSFEVLHRGSCSLFLRQFWFMAVFAYTGLQDLIRTIMWTRKPRYLISQSNAAICLKLCILIYRLGDSSPDKYAAIPGWTACRIQWRARPVNSYRVTQSPKIRNRIDLFMARSWDNASPKVYTLK